MKQRCGVLQKNYIEVLHYFFDMRESVQKQCSILNYKPIRCNVKVEWKNGCAVLVYPKNLTRFERWLQKRIGGPLEIRRPLDPMGTEVWKLCNGEHTVATICEKMRNKFGEDIEPVYPRVIKFLLRLAELNLIRLMKCNE